MTTPLKSKPEATPEAATPKASKARCAQCSKKLGVMAHVCKCEKQFCTSHLQPQEHQCAYDHRTAAKELLKTQLEIGPLSQKIEPI
jgi:predicted nucleic acid binding AN1-type Zn finger protein